MRTDNYVGRLLKDFEEKAKEILEIYTTLKHLKKYDDSIKLPDLSSILSQKGSEGNKGNDYKIRPDEFYGLSQTEAAEKFLRKIGHAAPLDSIYMALAAGGIKFTGSSPKVGLNVQLTRATRKFAKIPGETLSFGLLEFYGKKKSPAERVIEIADEVLSETEIEDNKS